MKIPKLAILKNIFISAFLFITQMCSGQNSSNNLKDLSAKSDTIILGGIVDIKCYSQDSFKNFKPIEKFLLLYYTIDIQGVFKDDNYNTMNSFMLRNKVIFIPQYLNNHDTITNINCRSNFNSELNNTYNVGDSLIFFLKNSRTERHYYNNQIAFIPTDELLTGQKPNLALIRKLSKYTKKKNDRH